jgi:hypothetical protein
MDRLMPVLGRQLPLAMHVNECLLAHVTRSTADVPVSANSSHSGLRPWRSLRGSEAQPESGRPAKCGGCCSDVCRG